MKPEMLDSGGKVRPGSEARACAALLIQEQEGITLTELGRYLNRDLSSLSQSANRLRKRIVNDKKAERRIDFARKSLKRIPKCQA